MTASVHWLYHFTRVEHLPTIIERGLLSDTLASEHLQFEVGNVGIKAQRARRQVPIAPHGVVSDYVPFYYAPRSPMIFAISHGNVSTYSEGCDRIVYLVTSLERLWVAGIRPVGTDRNALLDIATFNRDPGPLVDAVDWPLMKQRYWRSTPEDPDRSERRQAECLVHERVPWEQIQFVCARSDAVASEARAALARIEDDTTGVLSDPRCTSSPWSIR